MKLYKFHAPYCVALVAATSEEAAVQELTDSGGEPWELSHVMEKVKVAFEEEVTAKVLMMYRE